jgi:hypothetical protein
MRARHRQTDKARAAATLGLEFIAADLEQQTIDCRNRSSLHTLASDGSS